MSSPPAAEPAHRSPVSSPYDVSDVGGRLDPAVFDGGLERGVVAVVLVGLDQREAVKACGKFPRCSHAGPGDSPLSGFPGGKPEVGG